LIESLPIRVRLTLPFALAMALVLTSLGLFVYLRVGSTLLEDIDQGLRAQAIDAGTRYGEGESLLDQAAIGDAMVAEVIAADGSLVASTPDGLPPILAGDSLAPGTRTFLTATSLRGLAGSWRLHILPVTGGRVLVVGRSLAGRRESLEQLRHEFLFAAPAGLVLATLAGYLLAGAALRPVEAMRRRAAAISAETPGARLPVPAARDEIARLAETLNEMLARLEAAFQHERRFVSDASHELRTPLALLRTELELALRRPRSREELEHALRSAADETDRLTALAEDLLLVARADHGELPVNRERVAARELLDRVADRFGTRAREIGRSVSVGPADVDIDVDPLRLEQALGNLVANGLVHGAGTIELSARQANGRVELHVTDEGAGFPAGFADRAFARFSRAEEARTKGGTGLGLSIVQAIAIAHGGTTGIGTRAGGGADVWISV
jgi:two-component system OmpR family sensor kinase